VGVGQGAAFLGVSLLVIVTPGQDTALTIRNTLAGGRRGGVFTVLGVVSGLVTWALATSAGLAAVLVASQPAFTALRLAGAAYLVVLGVQALVSAVRSRDREAPVHSRTRPAARTAYRQGLLSNLGNAKAAIFFTSLLPQFAPGGEPAFWTMLPLGLCFAALTLAWLSAYAVAVARAAVVLNRPAVRRALDAVTGCALVLFGLRIGTSSSGAALRG
jgi:threonine/homoserine/homoserine lactone efflux protein